MASLRSASPSLEKFSSLTSATEISAKREMRLRYSAMPSAKYFSLTLPTATILIFSISYPNSAAIQDITQSAMPTDAK